MAIHVKLDGVLQERGITLTELAERVGLTLANVSVLKQIKRRRFDSQRWTRFARNPSVAKGAGEMQH
jgi:transcriptional regulator